MPGAIRLLRIDNEAGIRLDNHCRAGQRCAVRNEENQESQNGQS